jgi:hypothetical protein
MLAMDLAIQNITPLPEDDGSIEIQAFQMTKEKDPMID